MGKQGPCYHCGVTSEFLSLQYAIFCLQFFPELLVLWNLSLWIWSLSWNRWHGLWFW